MYKQLTRACFCNANFNWFVLKTFYLINWKLLKYGLIHVSYNDEFYFTILLYMPFYDENHTLLNEIKVSNTYN